MRARHAMFRFRLGCASLLMATLLAGCGSGQNEGAPTSDNPKIGPRRKEMSEFMKDQQAADKKARP